MPNALQLLPMLEPDEMTVVQGMIKDMNDQQAQQFANIYVTRRKDTQTILIAAIVGFIGVAGIQRFLVGQMGMGLLYFFTGGFCLIGTIIDIINYRSLTFDFNVQAAHQTSNLIKSMS